MTNLRYGVSFLRNLCWLVGAGIWLLACASSPTTTPAPAVSDVPVPTSSAPETPKNTVNLGEFRGKWNASTQSLSIEPKDSAASPGSSSSPGLRPQGFAQVSDSSKGFTTSVLSSFVGFSATYGQTGCSANQLCALVQVANTVSSSRTVDLIYVEITSIDSGFSVANSDATPTGYPLNCTSPLGCWKYGLVTTGSSAAKQWNFSLPSSSDFSFDVKIMGAFLRTSYGCSAVTISSSSFVDACSMSGATTVLASATPGTTVGPISIPFPFTLFDLTFDASGTGADMYINSNGALGFNDPTNNANVDLPDTSGNYDYMLFPYWDEIATSASGVCYATSGTTPNRQFAVTWSAADLNAVSGTQNMTFSAVLYESTDQFDFVYNRWSANTTNCASSTATRGSSATIGMQGADLGAGVLYNKQSFNAAYLPVRSASGCSSGYKLTCTASVVNP